MEIRLQSFQNGGPGPPKWSSWASKMEPGTSKMEPRASKMGSKWLQVGPRWDKTEVWRPPDAPRAPGRPPGSGPGGPGAAKMEPNGPQDLPKASQNGPKIGLKWVQNQVRKGIRFRLLKNVDSWSIFIKFPSRNWSNSGQNLEEILQRFFAWIDKCWKTQPSRNTVKTYVKSTFLRFQHYSTFESLIRKTCLKPSEIY